MLDSLENQLSVAEDNFFLSLSQGPAALDGFSQAWSKLQETLDFTLQQQTVDEDVLVFAHSISTRVEKISTHFLELYSKTDTWANALEHDLDNMMNRLSLNEQQLSSPSKRVTMSTADVIPTKSLTPPTTSTTTLPPYIAPAHAWLMINLHDPYPSKEVKADIAQESSCSFKDVDGWFTSVRKRIGWNKLRVKEFSNKRSHIVEAATKFFNPSPRPSEDDPDKPMNNSAGNYASDFIMIEITARELYVDKLHKTSLASSIETLVKNPPLVPGIRKRAGKAASSYPSPEHSPNRLPSPPLSPAIPSSAKRKRSDDASPDSHPSHHQKRARILTPCISEEAAAASLPSPAVSVQDISHEVSLTYVPPSRMLSSSPAPSQLCGKRKRPQSSDTEDDRSTGSSLVKRQHIAIPTIHDETCPPQNSLGLTISEVALEQWLNGTVVDGVVSDGIPSPVAVNSDETAPVEVDLFSYGSQYSPLTPLSLESPPSSPESLPPSATIQLPGIEGRNSDLQPVAENLLCSEGSSTSSWLAFEQVNHPISPSVLFSEIEANCPTFVDLTSMLPVSQLAFGNPFSKSRDSSSVPISNVFAPTDTNLNFFRLPFLEDQYTKFSRLQFLRSEVNFLEASLGAF